MKKLIATLLVPALALGLASCNRSEEDRNRITLALSTQTNPFFVELRHGAQDKACLLYTSPSPRDGLLSRMPSSA